MQRITRSNTPIFYQFEQWASAPIQHGVFTRHGGVSNGHYDSLNVGGMIGDDQQAVLENSRRVYDTLGYTPDQVCTVWQVHGADVVMADQPPVQRKWHTQADGMITNQPNVALSMRFADCVPVMFFDPTNHAIGIGHAGWRGTVAGVVLSVLNAMQTSYGTRPKDVQAAIGPSIGPDRYQVGEEVVAAVHDRFGDTDGLIQRSFVDGTAYLNLWEANRRLLALAGVAQIEVAEICTATHTDDFYSHRAEKGKTGRFASVIGLTER